MVKGVPGTERVKEVKAERARVEAVYECSKAEDVDARGRTENQKEKVKTNAGSLMEEYHGAD